MEPFYTLAIKPLLHTATGGHYMDSISAIANELLDNYQSILHERLVSRRASEDYLYWVRRFLIERPSVDTLPTPREVDMFLSQLRQEANSASSLRRAEVALDLFHQELLNTGEVA